MSDYVHAKVIRLPFPKEILNKFNTNDPEDCDSYLKEKLGELYSYNRNIHKFKIEYTDDSVYLDWVYYHTYGEESGDFGFSRYLTKDELNVIKPYFDLLEIDYNTYDLRRVEYCYYNCCECSDYYEVDSDDSKLLL